MDLNITFIKTVLSLFDEIKSNGISLVYLGEFNHEITKMFTAIAEDRMDRRSEERSTKRMVYHAMIETLQNMNKHSDEITQKGNIGKGLFFIGKKDDSYFIITSNKVEEAKKNSIKESIDLVNSLSKDELKEMYKKQLKEGRLSDKGGAGLGLIDIARKTEEKIEYQFLPIREDEYMFIFKVEIVASSILKKKD